jgi:hypothetical protein
MKLSREALAVLNNFAGINTSIVFQPGHEIRTISATRTVLGFATVPDRFPKRAAIYSLPRLLATYSLYKDAEIVFGDQSLTISEGRSTTKYTYTDPTMVFTPEERKYEMPSVDVTVKVSSTDLKSVLRAANVLELPQIAFVGEHGRCFLRAVNSKEPTADVHSIEIGETKDTFSLLIKPSHLSILPLDYTVELCAQGISKFEATNVKYFIGLDSKSTYRKGA